MKKDIEIPVVKDVFIGIVQEWNEEFLSKDWNAYLINNRDSAIEMAIVVTKGYDDKVKTSVMRHGLGTLEAGTYAKIELLQEELLKLNNEFYLTFFADNKLYEKKFLFRKNTVNDRAQQDIPLMGIKGILSK